MVLLTPGLARADTSSSLTVVGTSDVSDSGLIAKVIQPAQLLEQRRPVAAADVGLVGDHDRERPRHRPIHETLSIRPLPLGVCLGLHSADHARAAVDVDEQDSRRRRDRIPLGADLHDRPSSGGDPRVHRDADRTVVRRRGEIYVRVPARRADAGRGLAQGQPDSIVAGDVRAETRTHGRRPQDPGARSRRGGEDSPAEVQRAVAPGGWKKSTSRQYLHGTNVTFVKWTAKKGAAVALTHHVNEQVTWITEGLVEVYSQARKYT